MPNEEYAIVLDYLAHGKSTGYKEEPLAQVIGVDFFTLLEVVPKKELKIMDRIYIGKEKREEIEFIKRRINYQDLTSTALAEIENVIEKLIIEKEPKFVEFFNNAGPISIKRHNLDLIPGLGKKLLQEILDEREKEGFKSFVDLEKRIHSMTNPVKLIAKRVIEELEGGEEKHYLFTRPPAQKKEFEQFRR